MPVQRPADVVIRLYLHGVSRKELTRLARYTRFAAAVVPAGSKSHFRAVLVSPSAS